MASFISLLFAFAKSVFAQGNMGEGLSGPYLGQNLPADTPVIFASGIVSTEMYNHSSVSISPDGAYMFFLKMGMGYNEVYWASSRIIETLRIKSRESLDHKTTH